MYLGRVGREDELHLELGDVVIDRLRAGVLVLEKTLDGAQRPATPSHGFSPISIPFEAVLLQNLVSIQPKTLLNCLQSFDKRYGVLIPLITNIYIYR